MFCFVPWCAYFSRSRIQNPENSFNRKLHATSIDALAVSINHSGIERILSAIDRGVNISWIDAPLLAEMRVQEKNWNLHRLKNRKSYFLARSVEALRNLEACSLKISCSFVFWSMLHFKEWLTWIIILWRTFQNCVILKLFQIDRKRKNLRSKADQISERVLRTIFLFGAECFVLSRGVRIFQGRAFRI